MKHKITVFKSMNSDIPQYFDVTEVLSSIKNGRNRALVNKIRSEPNKEKRDSLKSNLYFILFSGEFKKRLNDELVEHSGLICIDFDNFPNAKELQFWHNKITKIEHCFAAFISPSGNGIKALFRIPKCKTNEEHNSRFDAIHDMFFDCKYFDKNGKGVCRVCYESFDENLFYNPNATEFTGIKIPEIKPVSTVKMQISEDSGLIFNRLIIWFESKYSLKKGSRNENLFYLFSSCRDYGLTQEESISFITSYASEHAEDFESIYHEIPIISKSAYSKVSAGKKMKLIPITDIASEQDMSFDIDDSEFIFELNEITETKKKEKKSRKNNDIIPEKFVIWKETPTSVKIDFLNLKKFLQDNGFYRYEVNGSSFIFVRVIENIIEEQDVRHIKDFLLKCLEHWGKKSVYNMIAENTKFKKEYLNYLDPIEIVWNKDTKDAGWLYFNNTAIKVTKNSIEEVDYVDLNGFIWKSQKINRDFYIAKPSEYNKCDFARFVSNVCDNDECRINSMKSAIGYLIHSHKSKSTVKAIVLTEETIADEAMGGTGKGLTLQVIGTVKNVVVIPGADFDTGKDFAWQRINLDTDIVLIDDVEKNFKHKKLFTFLTDGWPIRKLYRDEIFLAPEDSPKIVINTNYILKGDTDSYARRKFELEFHPHYNKKYQPIDDFKREFITEWDNNEKNLCDNFLISCLKYSIEYGLVEPRYVNLKYKKLLLNTSEDFAVFAESFLKNNTKFNKKDLFKYYQEMNGLNYGDYPDQKIFTKWMEYWGAYNEMTFNSRYGSGGAYFIYGTGLKEWRKNKDPF